MRTGISFEVTAADRTRLGAIAEDRNSPQKHVWRANIILLSGAGCGTAEIMQRTGKAKTCVWRWQERYMLEGVDGLLQDKTRPSRKPALPEETIARVDPAIAEECDVNFAVFETVLVSLCIKWT